MLCWGEVWLGSPWLRGELGSGLDGKEGRNRLRVWVAFFLDVCTSQTCGNAISYMYVREILKS